MPHPNLATLEFQGRYPTSKRFLDEIERALGFDEKQEFVADRVLARLGLEVAVGGARAAGLPSERGYGDLDVGLLHRAEQLARMQPKDRIAAMDGIINRLLGVPLGDHVVLEARRVENNAQCAFYEVTGRVNGVKVGQVGLDVDSAPHMTAPVVRDVSPPSGSRFFGLLSSLHSRQNPADVLAGKMVAIPPCAAADDKPRYAKHLCDAHYSLTSAVGQKMVNPALAARSIAILAQRLNIDLAELWLPYLRSARKHYRGRRKKISPDLPDSDSLLGDELNEVRAGFQPILDAALRGDFSTRTSRALSTLEYQRLGRSYTSDGATQVATSHRRAGYSKRKAVADAAARTPPGRPPSRSSRTSHGR